MVDGFAVLSDAPVGLDRDGLGFERYVAPLVEVITSDATETPFTIGVFGPWGSGKTSLLRMVGETLARDHADRAVRVEFNPWVHRGEPTMLLPLLHALHDAVAQDSRNRFADVAGKLTFVIRKLSTDILLRRVSGGAVTLDQIEKHAAEYAEQRGQVESAMRNLRRTLQEQADGVAAEGGRLVIFIDDLDRCEPHEIIDLLESIKLFLDLRNVVVVLAVAKNLVDQGVAVKYREFGFEVSRVLEIADEYLDKMVQLPLHLLPIDSRAYLTALDLPDALAEHLDLLHRILSPNPRRIKRVLNMGLVTHAIASRTPGLQDLRLDILLRLVALRVQSPALYDAVNARPELAAVIESRYAGRATRNELVRAHGNSMADSLGADLERFHGSQEYLAVVFGGTVFTEVGGDLHRYLTMLGG